MSLPLILAITGASGAPYAVRLLEVLAKLLHGLTIPALVVFGFGAGFGLWYYVGVVAATGILAYEHHLVRPGDHSRLDAAFFTMNGVMALVVFGFALMDRIV